MGSGRQQVSVASVTQTIGPMAPSPGPYICNRCQKSYKSQRSLERHKKNHDPNKIQCSVCQHSTNRKDLLKKHMLSEHSNTAASNSRAPQASISGSGTERALLEAQLKLRDLQKEIATLQEQARHNDEQSASTSRKRSLGLPNSGEEASPKRLNVGQSTDINSESRNLQEEPIATESRETEESEEITSQQNDAQNMEANDDQAPILAGDQSKCIYSQIASDELRSKQTEHRIQIAPGAFNIEQFDLENFERYQDRLTAIFTYLLAQICGKAPTKARGWLSMDFDNLKDKNKKHNRHINIGFTDVHSIEARDLMHEVERTLNSSESIKVGNGFKVFFNFVENPSGGARGAIGSYERRSVYNRKEFNKRKNSVIDAAVDAPEGDRMCLGRCLCVGKFIADHGKGYYKTTGYKTLADSSKKIQGERAKELYADAGVDPNQYGALTDVHAFQTHLSEYQIFVYESRATTKLVYPPNLEAVTSTKRIYLWLVDGHYSVLNPFQIAGFLGGKYYCHHCHQTWYKTKTHRCNSVLCKLCKMPNCRNTSALGSGRPVHCVNCNRDFPSEQCKVAHEKEQCKLEAKCLTCLSIVRRDRLEPKEAHHCLLNYCSQCSTWQPPGHTQCYVQIPKRDNVDPEQDGAPQAAAGGQRREFIGRLTPGPRGRGRQIIFADIESEQDPITHKHTPYLICMVNETGNVTWSWKGDDCLDQMLKALMENDDFYNSIICFHNFSGYDGILVLKCLFDKCMDPCAIFRHSKVLTMSLRQRKIRFLDTLLHISMALSRIPAAYAFDHEAGKGWFPFLMATKANRGYRGRFPDKKYFDPDNMGKKQRKSFEEWYAIEKQKYDSDPTLVYDLDEEMLKYCFLDCQILRRGFMAYRSTYMGICDNIDPSEFMTLPQYVNYRAIGMPENSIATLPPRGYGTTRSQSKMATYYLEWEAKKRGIYIKHSRNSSEIKIGPYYVDGYWEPTNGEAASIWEFNGCLWHGCPKTHPNRAFLYKGQNMEQRYRAQMAKEQFLRDRGYVVHSIWQCEYRALRGKGTPMDKFISELEKHASHAPLCPRDGLRGGRTNCIRLGYVPKKGEKLVYMDFRSLYPSINCGVRGQKFPVGHPTVFLHSFPPVQEWFGLAKVVINPPKQLLLPLLPVFSNGKVLYGLCGKCIEQCNNREKCKHSGAERFITDTFVTVELLKALELGYEIVDTIELWQWPAEQRSEHLFSGFLKKAYAQKVEASVKSFENPIKMHLKTVLCWPKDCTTEAERREYLQRYKDEQDIDIDYENVKENSALRENSKLSINNMWGYFGKAANEGRTHFVTTYEQFSKLSMDETLTITSTYLINEGLMAVEVKTADAYLKPDRNTNAPIACFTTSLARLQLYEEMEKLQDRLLYFDTGPG